MIPHEADIRHLPYGLGSAPARNRGRRRLERELPQGFEPWGSSLLEALTPIFFRAIPILWGLEYQKARSITPELLANPSTAPDPGYQPAPEGTHLHSQI